MGTPPRIAATLIATLVLLTACAAPSASRQAEGSPARPPAERKSITTAVQGALVVVSSYLAVSGTGTATPGTGEVARLLHLGLTGPGLTTDREPLLAEAVPSTENGLWKVMADGRMETTWRIRANALWHDRAPFTAQDLAFTARVAADKSIGVPYDRRFDQIERVETPDARTVTVTWKRPYIQADQLFGTGAHAPMPRHLLEDGYTNRKDAFLELPYWNREFVGTGAFRLREFVEGSHLTMEANDQFVFGRPKISEITVRFIPSPPTLVANVLSDAVDVVLGRSISLQQGAELRDQWRNGTVRSITGNPRSLVPQHQAHLANPAAIANSVEFRRALYHAIDRQEQALALGLGLGPEAHTGIPLEDPVYRSVEPALMKYDYDPRKTLAMLEGLGYARGTDGQIRDAANQPLRVPLRSSDREVNVNVILTSADYWKRIGIQAETEVVSLARSVAEPEFYASFPGFSTGGGNYAGLNTMDRLSADQVPSAQNNFSGQNTGGYVNAGLLTMIDRYFVTIPLPERIEILRSIFRHLTEQVIVMPLYYDANVEMVSHRMVNVSPGYLGNAHEWDRK